MFISSSVGGGIGMPALQLFRGGIGMPALQLFGGGMGMPVAA